MWLARHEYKILEHKKKAREILHHIANLPQIYFVLEPLDDYHDQLSGHHKKLSRISSEYKAWQTGAHTDYAAHRIIKWSKEHKFCCYFLWIKQAEERKKYAVVHLVSPSTFPAFPWFCTISFDNGQQSFETDQISFCPLHCTPKKSELTQAPVSSAQDIISF